MADILLKEKEIAFVESTDFAGAYTTENYMTDLIELVAGNTYTVIWDGTKHECVARNVSFLNGDEIEIGNANIVGIEDDSSEPFVLGYSPTMGVNLLYTNQTKESHRIAIYSGILEEEKVGANIVLFDKSGNEVTYEGIETVTFNTDDGDTATYTHGTLVDSVPEVAVDFSKGDQTVLPDVGKLMRTIVVKKPENLVPENIKKDEVVAGVRGLLETVDFDFSDEQLENLTYRIDYENRKIYLYSILFDVLNEKNGNCNVTIPDKIGGCNVVIVCA